MNECPHARESQKRRQQLGRWIGFARAVIPNATKALQDGLEFNARNQITLWGPQGEINDVRGRRHTAAAAAPAPARAPAPAATLLTTVTAAALAVFCCCCCAFCSVLVPCLLFSLPALLLLPPALTNDPPLGVPWHPHTTPHTLRAVRPQGMGWAGAQLLPRPLRFDPGHG
jgi:hypothetical protein